LLHHACDGTVQEEGKLLEAYSTRSGNVDPGPRTQDPGQRTQGRGPRTEKIRTKDPGQRTQDRGPRTEDPGQRT